MTIHFVMLPMEGGPSHVVVNPGLVCCGQPHSPTQAEVHFDDHHWLVIDKTTEQAVPDPEIAGR